MKLRSVHTYRLRFRQRLKLSCVCIDADAKAENVVCTMDTMFNFDESSDVDKRERYV